MLIFAGYITEFTIHYKLGGQHLATLCLLMAGVVTVKQGANVSSFSGQRRMIHHLYVYLTGSPPGGGGLWANVSSLLGFAAGMVTEGECIKLFGEL